jgi:predicted NBD/HSP70 family sugar kinase
MWDQEVREKLAALRDRSRTRVLTALRKHGVLTQGEVARESGLSRVTASELLAELKASGLVVERGSLSPPTQPGRPPVLLALGEGAGHVLGVDFGHSHVRVAVATLARSIVAERERSFPVDEDAAAALGAAADMVDEALEAAGVDRSGVIVAGVGVPGPLNRPEDTIAAPGIMRGWHDRRISEEIGARLGLPVEVENDANLGALAEHLEGAGRGYANLIYVKASTGVGAGLVVDGRLRRGAIGSAGAIGHTSVDADGPACCCGQRGCLEAFVGGPAILEALRRVHGDRLALADVVALARSGDTPSRRLLNDAGHRIGVVLARSCNLLDPERVIVGGALGAAGDLLLDPIRDEIRRWALPDIARSVTVAAADLGERAELVGALAMVLRMPSEPTARRIDAALTELANRPRSEAAPDGPISAGSDYL